MKRFLKVVFLFMLVILANLDTHAQANYKSSVGLGIDFGSGITLVGPSYKYFASPKFAIHPELLFGNGNTGISGMFQYHGSFPNANGLTWIAGGGTTILLAKGSSTFYLRGSTGLDYKLNNTPLALNFEWRPSFSLSQGGEFEPGRFGLGIRYVIKK